jgi:hypothetical protein
MIQEVAPCAARRFGIGKALRLLGNDGERTIFRVGPVSALALPVGQAYGFRFLPTGLAADGRGSARRMFHAGRSHPGRRSAVRFAGSRHRSPFLRRAFGVRLLHRKLQGGSLAVAPGSSKPSQRATESIDLMRT